MGEAVTETQQIYCTEIHSKEAMGWFFAHVKRFLEIAARQGKQMTVQLEQDIWFIRTLDDLCKMRADCFEPTRMDFLLRKGSVYGRVSFSS